jgi:Mn2+/Fe2+ NRAMP family transporter
MGLFIDDNSVMNGVLMIVGIIGAFVLGVYSLTLPPPMTTPIDRHAEEKAKYIYTRHDLWKS